MERHTPVAARILPILLAFSAHTAFALPDLTQPQTLIDLQERNGVTSTTVIFGDTQDDKVAYIPWDAAAIVQDQKGKPLFGFAYTDRSGTINVVVKAGYSPATKQKIKDLTAQGYEVRPMPVIAGSWSIVGFDAAHEATTLTSATIKGRYFTTIFPTVPVGISLKLGPQDMKAMVAHLLAGSTLALNYTYSFRAATPATDFEVSMDHGRVRELIDEKLEEDTNQCVIEFEEICSTKKYRLVSADNTDGKEVIEQREKTFSVMDIHTLTRKAIERSSIQITGRKLEPLELINAHKLVESLVQKTFFESLKTEGFEGNMRAEAAFCQGPNNKFELECQGYGQWFRLKPRDGQEAVGVHTTRLQTYGTQVLQAQVGFGLSSVCKDMSSYIIYVPGDGSPIQRGCPTSWPTPASNGSPYKRVDAVAGSVTTDVSGEFWKKTVPTTAVNPASAGKEPAGDFSWGSMKTDPNAPGTTVLPNP